MNKIIKTVSFVLLLCIPIAYGMKREQVIVLPVSEQFSIVSMQNGALDDVVKEIFKHACSNNVKAIATFRSVCRHWYNLFNPQTIKAIMSDDFEKSKTHFLSLINDNQEMIKIEKNQDCALLLLDMIQDATVYEELLPQVIKRNFPQFTQLLLEKGVIFDIQKLEIAYHRQSRGGERNCNFLFEDKYKDMFALLVHHGIDIYTPLNYTNETIMRRALGEALIGIGFMVTMLIIWPLVIWTRCYLVKVGIPKALRPLITILKDRYGTELSTFGVFAVAMLVYSNLF